MRNRISFFKDDLGNWINDQKQITQHAFTYFQQIYFSDHRYSHLQGTYGSTSRFYKIDLSSLDSPLHNQEVIHAVFSFKPYKAPRIDGFHPILSTSLGSSGKFSTKILT